MSFLTANSFVFNGINSDDYNVVIGWTDSDADVSTNGLSREILKSTFGKVRIKENIYGSQNKENIAFTFGIFRMEDAGISREESIRINQWLTASPLPQRLEFIDYDSYMLHYYAICTQITDITVDGRLIGKELTFETNSPFAFMEKLEKTLHVTDAHTFYLNNVADTYDGIYYPTITVQTASDTIVIENVTDQKSVTLNLTALKPDSDGKRFIRLNSDTMTALTQNNKLIPAAMLGWNEDYQSPVSATGEQMNHIYWVRLLPGMNEFKITGSCTFKIECEYPRKAGCL